MSHVHESKFKPYMAEVMSRFRELRQCRSVSSGWENTCRRKEQQPAIFFNLPFAPPPAVVGHHMSFVFVKDYFRSAFILAHYKLLLKYKKCPYGCL
jgi:hypothetical protein